MATNDTTPTIDEAATPQTGPTTAPVRVQTAPAEVERRATLTVLDEVLKDGLACGTGKSLKVNRAVADVLARTTGASIASSEGIPTKDGILIVDRWTNGSVTVDLMPDMSGRATVTQEKFDAQRKRVADKVNKAL